jgi:hypothetical protein
MSVNVRLPAPYFDRMKIMYQYENGRGGLGHQNLRRWKIAFRNRSPNVRGFAHTRLDPRRYAQNSAWNQRFVLCVRIKIDHKLSAGHRESGPGEPTKSSRALPVSLSARAEPPNPDLCHESLGRERSWSDLEAKEVRPALTVAVL